MNRKPIPKMKNTGERVNLGRKNKNLILDKLNLNWLLLGIQLKTSRIYRYAIPVKCKK